MTTLKTCFKCGKSKLIDEFYKHPRMGDGHLGKCKSCTRKDMREHRADNLEKVRTYDVARSKLPHRAALRARIFSEYREKQPKRRAAQVALGNAVRDGKINKLPCWVCGATKVEAHHPDYDAPLDVIWLCVPHHRQAHGLTRMIDDD